LWRNKSKHNVVSIDAFDVDADGTKEFISGWSNGKIEVRKQHNGDLIYSDMLSDPVAKIMHDDYRMDGRMSLIVCTSNGEVRGYLPSDGQGVYNNNIYIIIIFIDTN
jgi:Bardet-Biedl syndrome 2 protein